MQYKNILTLFAIFISLSFCGLAQDNWNQIAIVGNSLGTDKLTKTEVRDIYSGDQEKVGKQQYGNRGNSIFKTCWCLKNV